jgi:hypothetical protein
LLNVPTGTKAFDRALIRDGSPVQGKLSEIILPLNQKTQPLMRASKRNQFVLSLAADCFLTALRAQNNTSSDTV